MRHGIRVIHIRQRGPLQRDTMRVQGTTTSCALSDSDAEYAIPYLRRARTFVRAVAEEGRGMVYLIG
ncbi:hypothetical protein AUT26_13845 [[Arthrobacter] sp. ATCC 21022]|nr:hypothetical protein AUT26_13845 [Arthrobacter sp. ATCC 21022]KUR62650.1 hypothetical protein JM67_21195 [Arthrobacter sp. ATCC 21022]KUR64395.1 hypothetical protein JM67_12505 [Arthrobacter sp. ATCC 21022]